MNDEFGGPTLLEDWQHRQNELAEGGSPDARRTALAQLFGYLIERYQDSPTVQRRARFPRQGSLQVNERALIVHQHLGQKLRPVVNDRASAEARVHESLARLTAHQADPADDADDDDEAFEFTRPEFKASKKLWWRIVKRLRSGYNADALIRKALKQSPFLPATALNHLFERIDCRGDEEAFELLASCQNRSVPNYMLRAWRRRAIAHQPDVVADLLHHYWRDAHSREAKLQSLRIALADEHSAMRLAAIAVLGEIGSLDDVSLLADLLALPETPDDEHDQLAAAIKQIADRGSD